MIATLEKELQKRLPQATLPQIADNFVWVNPGYGVHKVVIEKDDHFYVDLNPIFSKETEEQVLLELQLLAQKASQFDMKYTHIPSPRYELKIPKDWILCAVVDLKLYEEKP